MKANQIAINNHKLCDPRPKKELNEFWDTVHMLIFRDYREFLEPSLFINEGEKRTSNPFGWAKERNKEIKLARYDKNLNRIWDI